MDIFSRGSQVFVIVALVLATSSLNNGRAHAQSDAKFISKCLAQLASIPDKTETTQSAKHPNRHPCWRAMLVHHSDGTTVNAQAQALHGVPQLRTGFSLTGAAVTVGVWDAGHVLANHLAFDNRATLKDRPNGDLVYIDGHATHVAGTIAASNKPAKKAEGMAPSARIVSYYSGDDDQATITAASKTGVTVTNHSYGGLGGWFISGPAAKCKYLWKWYGRDQDDDSVHYGRYDDDAAKFDSVAYSNPTVSMFVAAGNERGWIGEPDRLPPNTDPAYKFNGWHCSAINNQWVANNKKRLRNTRKDGYDTLVGNGLGKNVITIGAMPDTAPKPGNVQTTEFSSFGPADDGRIKPDVVANGALVYSTAPPKRCEEKDQCRLTDVVPTERHGFAQDSGTSMASPVAAGIGALLNELASKRKRFPRPLFSDEMKAVLIHTAISGRNDGGPTYDVGWGAIDAPAAGRLIAGRDNAHLERRALKKGDVVLIELERPQTVRGRVTLAWLDPAAPVVALDKAVIDDRNPVLINKLAMTLVTPDERKTYHPWSLDPQAPKAPPTNDKPNGVDNVNRFDVPSLEPQTGKWKLKLDASNLVADELHVAIAYYGFRPK